MTQHDVKTIEQCEEEFEDDDGMGTFICELPKGHGGLHESASWRMPDKTSAIEAKQ